MSATETSVASLSPNNCAAPRSVPFFNAGAAAATCDAGREQPLAVGGADAVLAQADLGGRTLPAVPVQNPTAGVWQSGNFQGMPYRIMFPSGYDPGNHVYPLVLILHGIDQRGTDNQQQLATDIGALANSMDFRANVPMIMVAPQCPTWDFWGAATESAPTWSEATAVALTESLVSTLAVDPTRVTVTGLSLGGIGTWDIVNRYPGIFAAAAPIAGAGLTSEAPNLVNLPILAVHGQLDFTVPVFYDEQMYATMQALGGKMIYYELPWTFHDVWDSVYPLTEFWQWLYAQHK